MAPFAGAHEFNARGRAKIHDGGPSGANGSVTSSISVCEKNRLVRLYMEQDGPDEMFGSDRTDAQGMWDVDADLFAGSYYVRVVRKHLTRDGHDHDCLPLKSISVRL
jgi:hypothetical protein